MPYQGHCMCHNIQVTLEERPENTLRCHCRNCARSGGGSSLNYTVDEPDVTIDDPQSFLKDYEDNETTSGNCALRQFCSNCGSPIVARSRFPGKTLVKASLFDEISRPVIEAYTDRKQKWLEAVEGAEQT
ncbi:GFA family protein [Aspergillus chevalieri]|uniref:CENP-V/GFA domain-containing protein n=1 Tax=Aspergillus chevalieri TaxID=182096 RepID=A0A7R7ZTA1_ASPCH|nr:uncharacterized protein ACHE_80152S [Aspergillus chevalieri]BCR92252.1 hypothetical protein ACHE_80152S [Aspergillus chevalieri]